MNVKTLFAAILPSSYPNSPRKRRRFDSTLLVMFETLESRTLLSAVSAAVQHGSLFVRGDGFDNTVVVRPVSPMRNVSVS